MDSNLKIVLILAAFAIITVLLFRPYSDDSCGKREQYSPDNIDPTNHPYSRDVAFRPHSTGDVYNDGSSFQLHDHIDDQNNAMAQRAAAYNMMARNGNGNGTKRVRFADQNGASNDGSTDIPVDVTPPVRDVDIRTSHDNTHIDRNRVLDSNNISGYCMNNELIEDDDPVYSDKIHEVLDMDMDDATYHNLIAMRPHMKTYIEIDEDSGKFDQKKGKGKQDIDGLTELTQVINAYRNNTMRTINGGNDANRYYYTNFGMYNHVH